VVVFNKKKIHFMFEIAGVSDITNYLVTNHVNVWVGFSISLLCLEAREAQEKIPVFFLLI